MPPFMKDPWAKPRGFSLRKAKQRQCLRQCGGGASFVAVSQCRNEDLLCSFRVLICLFEETHGSVAVLLCDFLLRPVPPPPPPPTPKTQWFTRSAFRPPTQANHLRAPKMTSGEFRTTSGTARPGTPRPDTVRPDTVTEKSPLAQCHAFKSAPEDHNQPAGLRGRHVSGAGRP